jgi:pantetheine-phosphate adenylyltransferase
VPRQYRLAVLGGTFDHFHVGHEALLSTAFRVGDQVAVGLTTDRFVASHPKPGSRRMQSYSTRRATLVRWLRRTFPGRNWWVVPLEDRFGRSVEPGVDVLVVSPDTRDGGRAVNQERRRLGRAPVALEIVPLVIADDLAPVSSRRIRSGAIDPAGHRRSRIRVALKTDDPRDIGPARRALRRAFPRGVLVNVGRPSGPRPRKPPQILVATRRRPSGGWTVTERSDQVRLAPRTVRGDRPGELERGLRELLQPREERKLFGTPRSSAR